MKKSLFCLILFYAASIWLSAQANQSSFVKVEDSRLVLNGKPYYFCGTNFWYGYYLGSKGKTGNRERLTRELDQMVKFGITNLRILASSEECIYDGTLKPAIQPSKGTYNEELLDGLDFLLAEIGKRKMTAVLYLNNFWQWCGGMTQYLAWVNNGKNVDPTTGAWNEYLTYATSFYSNKEAINANRNYISMLINRKNGYTGLKYKDDPTIMAWQLANEPRGGEGTDGMKHIDEFYRWVDETAAFIHSLDKNHLVSSGSEGIIGTMGKEEIYEKAYQSKYIDYLTFHLWAKNWGWFNGQKYRETLTTSKEKAAEYINKHIQLARKMGKPIVMEEFGLDRDSSRCMPGTPATARNDYYRFIYAMVDENVRNKAPFMGTNFWGWAGEAVPSSADGKHTPKSPFLADPWQEPQGLNSVFISDDTTLTIIQDHAEQMNKLNR